MEYNFPTEEMIKDSEVHDCPGLLIIAFFDLLKSLPKSLWLSPAWLLVTVVVLVIWLL